MAFRLLYVDVTERCSFACDYCYKRDMMGSDLGFDTATEILSWFFAQNREARLLEVVCMGGEPLLAIDTIERLVYWAGKRRCGQIRWGLATNLSLLDAVMARRLSELGVGINASVDGTQAAHDAHRKLKGGRPSWKLVKERIPYALAVSPESSVMYTVHADCVRHMHAGTVNLLGLGFRRVQVSLVPNPVDWTEDCIRELDRQMGMTARWFIEECLREERLPKVKWILDGLQGLRRPGASPGCGACKTLVAADVDGYLYPCYRYAGVSEARTCVRIGHVKVGIDARRVEAFRKLSVPGSCFRCEDRFFCQGGCWAHSWAYVGNHRRPIAVVCAFSRSVRRWATFIHASLVEVECRHYEEQVSGTRFRCEPHRVNVQN